MTQFIFLILSLLIIPLQLQAIIRIGILTDVGCYGERETASRIKKAAEGLGWEVILDEFTGRQIKNSKNLDFIISFCANKNVKKNCFNYLITSFCHENYYEFPQLYKGYDGFFVIADPKKYDLDIKNFHCIRYYPTVQETTYQKVDLTNLVTLLPLWGNRLDDPKYMNLYSYLDQSGFIRFYGFLHKNLNFITNSYKGEIPFDGVSIIPVFQEHGIVLVLHSDVHFKQGIPSGRIFEAAAASAVIISDKNTFVQENFGDSVFYIDTSLSAEEIFSEIQRHMEFIRLHPEIALGMAEKAHQIFNENFGLTKMLLQLKTMHEKIKAEQKYPKASQFYSAG
jgi:hypothetical protein